ncbi:MAG TPA: transaldolase family protein [Planctomycetota bacterium]|nr:transaldolase family protein [Planctomycetota bacterium]
MSSSAPPQPETRVIDQVHALAREGVDLEKTGPPPPSDPFWKGLREVGTELWLDTGDMDGAAKLWTAEISALTTNNTLLNTEVQKGIYDGVIDKAAKALSDVDPRTRVIEIAFLLNARHGLRLARRFGGKVSVELHTDLSHDVEAAIAYGRRFHRLEPDRFIVKVPLTAAGLISTRTLRKEGIPVNFTLGFSARHNFIATAFAEPLYVNVFLGRLGSYFADNKLGDGKMVGERATLASQAAVKSLSRGRREPTRQIAASLRAASQTADLAGVDVFTMPLKVAEAARKELDGKWRNRLLDTYSTTLAPGVDPADVRWETLWDISAAEKAFADALCARPPQAPEDLIRMAHETGARDLFPTLAKANLERISTDGKIPKHDAWRARVRSGDLAVDTLLNLAGLASFAADQKELDDRIRRWVG